MTRQQARNRGKSAEVLAISEKSFESQVKQLAQLYGWLYYHTWRSIHSPAGFPDCVMVRGKRVVYAELKAEKKELTWEQAKWLDALRYAGQENYLWKPSQIEEIVEILR